MIKTFQEVLHNDFKKHLADCVVLTHDNRILLQRRQKGWSNEGGLNLFGGHVEGNETVEQALIREMHEELGAKINVSELSKVGIVAEDFTGYKDAVHIFFWHDKENTIEGCYECLPEYFQNVKDAVAQKGLMEYACWALKECEEKGLLK